jgi:hydroxypyruvate reductase
MTLQDIKARAIKAFNAGVAAADPAAALHKALINAPLSDKDRGAYIIISAGKAACKMAQTALENVPKGVPTRAIAVTNPENAYDIEGCEVFQSAHPIPDRAGLEAGKRVIEALKAAGAEDTVLMLISGGSSSLLPAPAVGITLDDKKIVNEILLSSGLDITQMNLVRQSLSRLKGGKVLDIAHPAKVRSFILSDVLGDDLRVVGSGPTVGPIGSAADARRMLIEKGLFTKMPDRVRVFLEAQNSAPLIPHQPDATMIGGNNQSLAAMARSVNAERIDTPLEGDVVDAAATILEAVNARQKDVPFAIAFGGETTVQLKGTGRGGRNQELALQFARLAQETLTENNWCFLSGGTDGRDGPTDAAGGVVDAGTIDRIKAAGGDFDALLGNNDSYRALELSGDRLMTGGTGTNVADLQMFIMT